VKLIAEPWDIGEGGYQVGRFPPGWTEWNGKYRDCARDFWRGQDSTLAEFAYRLTGSSDLYEVSGRRPTASINFITAHDGFTLNDLVSYNEKHNEANGENNNDGESNNRSWNCGAEGSSDDPAVLALRVRQKRNFLTTLLVSQGIPMIVHGDEIGRTQQGNNNAFCQDNEISWVDWEHQDGGLLQFSQALIQLRKDHPVFRQLKWFKGIPVYNGVSDVGWFSPAGEEMSEQNWAEGNARSLGVFLNGQGIRSPGIHGERVEDESFFLLFNAHYEPVEFTLPESHWGRRWRRALDTAQETPQGGEEIFKPGSKLAVEGRSVIVLIEAE
jgi:glycogen operon protein